MFCSVYISNMASESPRIEVRENEVLLFKNGQPVLRVERGTTLRIIKLLYQADLRNKGTVIGVRPQTNDVLPCVLTLDHSPLELARYEIIAFESTQETPFQTTRVTTAAKSLPQESFSNTSRYPLPTDGVGVGIGSSRQQQEDPSDILHEMAPSVMQKRQSINHTVPLTVNVSPETTRRSLVSQGTTGGSSSLLLTKKDIFPSCSSGFSLSRRKKTARKSVLPRRISSISSPIHSLGKHNRGTDEAFFQNKVTAHSTSPVLAGRLVGLDEVTGESAEVEEALDSPGLCDSTENENLANEEPARTGDEEPLTEHQQAENHNANHLPSYSVEDSAEFPNYHSIESSSTNGSSPSISEGQSMVIDIIDSRESSCGENDSDSNHVSSKHSSHQQRLCISGLEASSGVRYKEDATINQGRNDCSHTPTAVVLLENTVQVKMEPKEMAGPSGNTLPDQNGKDINFPFSMNSNGESNDALNSEDHYQTQKLNSMLISSQDGDSSSLPMQQAPALLPQVVSVVGAASEGKTAEDSYHHHHHHHDHRAQDTGDRHNCDVCQKQFDSPNSVLRHKRSHTGERPYICKICGWGFNLSGNLNQHLAIHQKVKPFKCVYCGKTFARSNVLKAHVRCHTGERPFQCQLCGSKFIIGHNLRKHMVTRHGIKEDDKMYLQNNVQGSDGSSQPSENGDHE